MVIAAALSLFGGKGSATYFSAASRAARITAAAAVGGTASVMSGGKFANGAVTGAFSRAFNDEANHKKEEHYASKFKIDAKKFVDGFSDILGDRASDIKSIID